MDRFRVSCVSLAFLLLSCVTSPAIAAEPTARWRPLVPLPPAAPAPSFASDVSRPAIVGGTLAAEGAWPMAVFLTLYISATSASSCGGTVVAPYFVMTAAHCVASDAGQLAIIAASATVASNDAASSQLVWATSVTWHSGYQGAVSGNDIALLRLGEPLTVASASLSTPSDDAASTAAGVTTTAVGWGLTAENGTSISRFLRQVDMPVVANATCASQLGSSIFDSQVCAGETAGGKDTCQGDSGGPLFARDTAGTYRQIGITSYGIGCARPSLAGVYTRVASYYAWVQSTIAAYGIATQFTGWWWNDAEPGTGFSVEKRGSNMFVAAFAYRSDGSPVWYVATAPMTSDSLFEADLYEYAGGQSLTGSWRAAAASTSPARLTIAVASPTQATMTIGSRVISAQRFPFSDSYAIRAPASGLPEAGWWWDESEPGRGFYLDFQESNLFFAGYMYDEAGAATWYLANGGMTTTSLFTGSLQQYGGGQTLTGSWQAASVSGTSGTISLSFASTTTATLVLPNGTSVPLARFQF